MSMEPGTQDSLDKNKEDPAEVEFPGRRSFLGMLTAVGGVAVGFVLSAPIVRFVLHPLLSTTTEIKWADVGSLTEFGLITTPIKRTLLIEQRDGWRKIITEKAVYVLRDSNGQLRILSPVCPHLGCFVSWRESQNQFVCPCHAAIFTKDGNLISGPPPRSMDELENKVEEGMLKVKYQYFRQLIPVKEVMG